MKINNWRKLLNYIFFNPQFMWGLLLDMLILPLALIMFIVKWLYPSNLDQLFSRKNLNLPPVLLIHGSGANEAQWLISTNYLSAHFNIYLIQLNQLVAEKEESIRDFEVMVEQKIQQIYNIHQKPVILIGHSMGGLVAASCVEHQLLSKKYIEKIITINSPWKGAPALEFLSMGTKRHQEMTPGSDFLVELNQLLDKSEHHYICFGSKYDPQVPWEFTFPKHNKNTQNLTHCFGHTSVIIFPFIFHLIKNCF